MKYIVTWILQTIINIPCPPTVSVDEFGRRHYQSRLEQPFTLCYTVKVQNDTLKKEFNNKSEAYSFYNRGKEQSRKTFIILNGEPEGSIQSIKIDSVKN